MSYIFKIESINDNIIYNVKFYIGNFENASNLKWLKSHNITHIINCTEELPNYFPYKFKYLKLNLKDSPEDVYNGKFHKILDTTNYWINNAIKENFNDNIVNSGILIHCFAGVSRSVSITMNFMLDNLYYDGNGKIKKMKANEARDKIRKRRKIAKPYEWFYDYLVYYYETQ